MKKVLALGLPAVLSFVSPAESQQKPVKPKTAQKQAAPKVVKPAAANPKPSQAAPAPPVVQYGKVPFDTSSTKVPVGFNGHDVVALFKALSAKLSGKGEFETTEAYNNRIATALTQPIEGQLTTQSTLALVVNLTSDGEYPDLKYDADAQLLQFKKYMGEVPSDLFDLGDFNTRKSQTVILAGRDTEKVLRVYTGENAYGAKVDVVKKERDTYDLIALNPKQFDLKKGTGEFDYLHEGEDIAFDVEMDIATAQKSKANLDLLVIFQIAPPYVGKSVDFITPNIDNPQDVAIRRQYIYANVSEMWLYDSKTGEVYKKLAARR